MMNERMDRARSAGPDRQRGSMLLETLIAILIFSMGILAIIGLQASMSKYTTDAKVRSDASFLASRYIGEMWGDRNNLSAYVKTDDPITQLPSGKRTIAVSGSQVTVTLTWQIPGETATHRYVTVAQISG